MRDNLFLFLATIVFLASAAFGVYKWLEVPAELKYFGNDFQSSSHWLHPDTKHVAAIDQIYTNTGILRAIDAQYASGGKLSSLDIEIRDGNEIKTIALPLNMTPSAIALFDSKTGSTSFPSLAELITTTRNKDFQIEITIDRQKIGDTYTEYLSSLTIYTNEV